MPHAPDIDYTRATDRALVTRYRRQGDEQAFAEIVSRYYALVLGLGRRMLGCPHAAEDVLQATFLVLAKDVHKIRKRASLASWLYGVAFRISARHVRRRASRQVTTLKDEAMVADDPLQKLCEQFEQQAALEELHRLSEKVRAPMVMRYLQGKSNSEVAESLALSESAVEGRLKRGRNQLRMRLARQGVTFAAAIATLDAMKQSASAAGNCGNIAKTVEVCMAGGAGTNPTAAEIVRLADEEVWKMTTRTLARNVLAVSLTAAIVATGWSLSGEVSVNAQDGAAEVLLESAGAQPDEKAATTAKDESATATITPKGAVEDTPTQRYYYYYSARDRTNDSSASSRFSLEQYTEIETRIKEALKKPAELTYTEQPLNQVMADLADRFEIPILLDPVGLDDEGIDASSLGITCDISNVRLTSGLSRMFDQYHLTFVIKDEVLLVTSKDRATRITPPRVYRAKSSWQMSSDELVDVITSTVEPDTWDAVGGPSSIIGIHGGFVISTSDAIHDQVNNLLSQIDRMNEPTSR